MSQRLTILPAGLIIAVWGLYGEIAAASFPNVVYVVIGLGLAWFAFRDQVRRTQAIVLGTVVTGVGAWAALRTGEPRLPLAVNALGVLAGGVVIVAGLWAPRSANSQAQ